MLKVEISSLEKLPAGEKPAGTGESDVVHIKDAAARLRDTAARCAAYVE